MLNKILLFTATLMTAFSAFAVNGYLYTEKPIPVRQKGHLRAKTVKTLAPNESFKVIKWNKHNTLIQMKDGSRGYIDKSLVEHFAPGNGSYTGYEGTNFEVMPTNDKTYEVYTPEIQRRLQRGGARGNREAVSSRSENDYIQGYDDDGQENGYLDVIYGPGHKNMKKVDLLNKLAVNTWRQAVRKRRVARFMGGGYRSGNRSKGMCAAAVKDALIASGVCKSRPPGNAYNTHRLGTLKKHCPGLVQKKGRDASPWKAKGGSVIVYSGYSGRRKHNYGHIEIKIPITPELLRKIGRRTAAGAKVGGFLYCSDFCRTRPTKTKNNRVQAIYELK